MVEAVVADTKVENEKAKMEEEETAKKAISKKTMTKKATTKKVAEKKVDAEVKKETTVEASAVVEATSEQVMKQIVYQKSAQVLDREPEVNETFGIGEAMPIYLF